MNLFYKETKMKKIIITFIIFSLSWSANVFGKTKEVCKDTKDKYGKVTHICKKIKVHKKYDGKKVQDVKKTPSKKGGK